MYIFVEYFYHLYVVFRTYLFLVEIKIENEHLIFYLHFNDSVKHTFVKHNIQHIDIILLSFAISIQTKCEYSKCRQSKTNVKEKFTYILPDHRVRLQNSINFCQTQYSTLMIQYITVPVSLCYLSHHI